MPTNSIAIIDHVGCKAGMDNYSGALAKGFIDNGLECFLFSNFKIGGARNYTFFNKQKGSILSSVLNQIIPFWKAAKVCRKYKVDECLVHFFSFEVKDLIALRILRFLGLRVIGVVHDVEHLAGNTGRFREKILSNYCDKIMVHNIFSKQALLNAYPLLESKTKVIAHMNFHNLPLGKNKAMLRAKWNFKNDKRYLLFFGQIKDAKGLEILLDALPKVNEDVELIIAGKVWQTTFDKYQNIIEQCNLQKRVISFIRFISDQERDELFTACDAIVLPYKKIYQSGVMQVAISYNIPIISSDIPPFKEIIGDDENGYLFESENSNHLSETINYVTMNMNEAKVKSQLAYVMAKEKFSNSSITNKIINW